MIHAILLNPTIDVIYKIDNFQVGGTFKVEDMMELPVGKSISFSLGARELEEELELNVLALIGREEAQKYATFLEGKHIEYEFIDIHGKTRSNKTIIDPKRNTTTHIREKGFSINAESIHKLKTLLKETVKNDDICVFGGSIPPGTGDDIYYDLINLVKQQSATSVLDTSGPSLKHGIEAQPRIIKPNLSELSQILNDNSIKELTFENPIKDGVKLVEKSRPLLSEELQYILITLGEKGAIFLSKEEAHFGRVVLKRDVLDTVGAGDSFLAGFVVSFSQGKDILTCFRRAIATGAASCLKIGPGIFNREDVSEILRSVKTKKLS